ncbi:class I SAM-dependent RNA methyltransferase [Roseivivax jejudonensis]|uniref:class I SAM-dependent RNA methyltransferase n=1 Tax=Roseivivax jejudonensis TaxID=1529041 RepID=UPI000A26E791|nr:class I SAM-dependent RNA methyltransferase [Roseivivax jejudonensis]
MKLTIDRLGHLGDGIATGPVFVPGTLPGETVAGDVDGDTMPAPKIVTPSPDRVAPPCPHARTCGGCQLQHAADPFVESWKVDVVRTALAAHGLDAPMRPVATSPERSRRRATFSARRTKSGALAGFHRKRSDVIVPVPECRVVHPDIAAALPLVESLARLGGSRKAELSVQITRSNAGLDVAVTGGKPADAALRSELAALARARNLARIAWGADETLERRPPAVRLGPAEVIPPPGAFLQATLEGEAALQAAVAEAVGDARRIVDLFSGCGTFTLPLAARAEVHAVEASRDMLAALDRGWRHGPGLRRVTTEARDLFRDPLSSVDLARTDAVVIDPPRAGAEAQVAQIVEAAAPRVAHVSCNPVTFARDCAAFVRSGYRLDWVQVVDQFRWSSHIEIAAALSRG